MVFGLVLIRVAHNKCSSTRVRVQWRSNCGVEFTFLSGELVNLLLGYNGLDLGGPEQAIGR